MAWEETLYKKNDSGNSDNRSDQSNWYVRGGRKSALTPSGLFVWLQHHSALRQQGLMNEIDLNEITVALNGSINKWSPFVKKHRKELEDFINKPTAEKWEEIKGHRIKNDQIV